MSFVSRFLAPKTTFFIVLVSISNKTPSCSMIHSSCQLLNRFASYLGRILVFLSSGPQFPETIRIVCNKTSKLQALSIWVLILWSISLLPLKELFYHKFLILQIYWTNHIYLFPADIQWLYSWKYLKEILIFQVFLGFDSIIQLWTLRYKDIHWGFLRLLSFTAIQIGYDIWTW